MLIQPQTQEWNGIGMPEAKGRLRWVIDRPGQLVVQSWTPNAELKFSIVRHAHPDATPFRIEFLTNDGIQLDLFSCPCGHVNRVEYQHLMSSATGFDLCAGIRVVTYSSRSFLCLIDGSIIEEEVTLESKHS